MLWLVIALSIAAVIIGAFWTIVVWVLSDLPVGSSFCGIKKLERSREDRD